MSNLGISAYLRSIVRVWIPGSVVLLALVGMSLLFKDEQMQRYEIRTVITPGIIGYAEDTPVRGWSLSKIKTWFKRDLYKPLFDSKELDFLEYVLVENSGEDSVLLTVVSTDAEVALGWHDMLFERWMDFFSKAKAESSVPLYIRSSGESVAVDPYSGENAFAYMKVAQVGELRDMLRRLRHEYAIKYELEGPENGASGVLSQLNMRLELNASEMEMLSQALIALRESRARVVDLIESGADKSSSGSELAFLYLIRQSLEQEISEALVSMKSRELDRLDLLDQKRMALDDKLRLEAHIATVEEQIESIRPFQVLAGPNVFSVGPSGEGQRILSVYILAGIVIWLLMAALYAVWHGGTQQ